MIEPNAAIQDFLRRIAATEPGSREAMAIYAEAYAAGLAEAVAELHRQVEALSAESEAPKCEWCERNGVPYFPDVMQ